MSVDADPANEALTIRELNEASQMGLSVAVCLTCKRPTLYVRSPQVKVEPVTCGRMPCLAEAGEVLGKR